MHEVQVAAHCAGLVPLWVQDRSGLFPMCLVSESPVRTNKLIILTLNTIILINVMHTRGFVQLETHIYIHRMPSFWIATIWSVDLRVLNAQLSVNKHLSYFTVCLLIVRRVLFHGASRGLFFFSLPVNVKMTLCPRPSRPAMNACICHEIIHSISPHWTGHWLGAAHSGSASVSWLWILWYCKWLEIPLNVLD